MFKDAFTLIELLVVITVIGVLSATGIIAYNNYTLAAKISSAKAYHSQVTKAIKTDFFNSCEVQNKLTTKAGIFCHLVGVELAQAIATSPSEILVVVAIIGILAVVGVVAFSGFSNASKVKTTLFNHTQAVKTMKTLLFSCETTGSVKLKTDINGSESNFACSTGANNLRVQFTAHFFWSGFRNVWDTQTCCAVAGDLRMKGYMIGYSCSNNGAMGFTLICNESSTRMWMETNLGPTVGCSGCATTTERVYIDIPR